MKLTVLLAWTLIATAGPARAETTGLRPMLALLPDDAWQRVLDIRVETDPRQLAQFLQDDNGVVRIFAARRFSVLGPRAGEASADLIRVLEQDEENLVRAWCASAIGRFVTDTTAAVAALERVSRTHESLLVREAAGNALAKFGEAGLLAVLGHMRRGQSCDIGTVYSALLDMTVEGGQVRSGILPPAIVDTLVAMVTHPVGECDRRAGMRFLSHLGADRERVAPILVALLADVPDGEADQIANALILYRVLPGGRIHAGHLYATGAEGTMRYVDWARFVRDRPGEDWLTVVIGPRLAPIAEQLGSDDVAVQRAGLAAAFPLWDVAAPLVPRASELTLSPDSTVRDAAWKLLGRADLAAAQDAVVRALATSIRDVRLAAIARVPELHASGEAGIAVLRPLARAEDPVIRHAAVRAIASYYTRATSGIDILVEGLDDPATQNACGGALGSMGPAAKAAIPRLQRLFDDAFARAGADTSGAYPVCVPMAGSIAAIDSAAGRAVARRLATLDNVLAREVAARILDPAHPERAARRAPIPAREIDILLENLAGADAAARERARATFVDAGVAATAATPRIEALARSATGPDRALYYEVLEAIDPSTKYPYRY